MAKKLGKNLRLYVETAVADTFAEPLGQRDLTINRSTSPIDTSTKDTGNYGTSAPGQKSLTLSQQFVPDLPDTAYARMKELDGSGETATYQVREAPYADTDVVFECVMYTSFGNTDAGTASPVGSTAELSAAAAPTVDDI